MRLLRYRGFGRGCYISCGRPPTPIDLSTIVLDLHLHQNRPHQIPRASFCDLAKHHDMPRRLPSQQEEGVIDRRMVFCPNLRSRDVSELILSCPCCEDFFLFCCGCSQRKRSSKRPCHHYRVVFTDGACLHNGKVGATAGIAAAYGTNERAQWSYHITEEIDPNQKRTSQRAELLAAILGLDLMAAAHDANSAGESSKRAPDKDQCSWIVTTDSEYVTKGMTE